MSKKDTYSTTFTAKQWSMIRRAFPASTSAETLRLLASAYFATQDAVFPTDDTTHGGYRRYAGRPKKTK